MAIPITLKVSAPQSSSALSKLIIAETDYETTTIASSNIILTTTNIISGTPPNTSYITEYVYNSGVVDKWYAVRWQAVDSSISAWSNRVKLIYLTLRNRIARRLKDLADEIDDTDWDDIINMAEADLKESAENFDTLGTWHQAWLVKRGQRHALEELTSDWLTSFNIGSGSKRLDLGSVIYQLQRQINDMDKEWRDEINPDLGSVHLSEGKWVVSESKLTSYQILWETELKEDETGYDYSIHRRQSYYNSDVLLESRYPDEDDVPY